MSDDAGVFDKPEALPIKRAIEKARKGKETNEVCYFCKKELKIQAGGAPSKGSPTIFRVSCFCGQSNGMFMGL